MAAETAGAAAHDIVCPDPTVHAQLHRSADLQEQASAAALLAVRPQRSAERPSDQPPSDALDADGKLSSRSAATSLKHAKPQDLPSFPSNGNTANSASKAALLANDYKMNPLWQPEQSRAGSKAARLAHDKGSNVELWQASATSDGYSAATLAMRNKGLGPNVERGVAGGNRREALLAATMSHNRGRQRADSTPSPLPQSYPDAHNSTANALNAATVSHSASVKMSSDGWDSQANQAARIKNSHIDPAMFGDRPPVEIEREEAKHQAALRASAISMAKQIMETQDRTAMTAEPADVAGAQAAAIRTSTTAQPDIKQEAMRYINLQEAAHKLAAERLAKVDKNFEAAQYREYYGYGDKSKRLSNRLSMRSIGGSRQRKRASSEGTADLDDSDDEGRALRIRSQTSQLSSGLSRLDGKKQQDDRARLLAAAEKSVSARMHLMDEKVFANTGKVPPALMEEWEEKARKRAQQEREQQAQNPGKTHVGGGKFMAQSEIDAIAAARLKPTLDEINSTAEKRRARDEELRLEKEEQERQRREEKAKQREEKEEEKAKHREEKEEQRRIKGEEKARKEEEKRVAKEEKRKSREIKRDEARDAVAAGAAGAALAEVAEKVKDDEPPASGSAADGVQRHRSALGRLKDRFRRSPAGATEPEHEEKDAVATEATADAKQSSIEETPAVETVQPDDKHDEVATLPPPVEQHSTIATEEAVPEVRVSEPTDGDDADDEDDDESNKWKPVAVPTTAALMAAAAAATSPRANFDDEDTEDEPLTSSAKPQRPPFEQKPSLSGYHNDELPLDSGKPDLERHISQIPESDGESSLDEDDWNDERKPLGQDRAQAVAERVATAPVMTDEPPIPAESTLAQLDNQRAEPPKSSSTILQTSEPPKGPTEAATTNNETLLQATDEQRDHSILRGIDSHGKKDFEQGDVAAVEATTLQNDSNSRAANEPAKLRKKQDSSEHAADEEKERKGLRGLFSKLRHKDSKSETKSSSERIAESEAKSGEAKADTTQEKALPPVDAGPSFEERVGTDGAIGDSRHVSGIDGNPAAEDPLVAKSVEPGFDEDQRVGIDGPIGDSKHVSGIDGNPRAESPSSFKRGEGGLNDPDDVSSSGVDEDDVSRGRGGRLARRLGLGSLKKKDKGKTATKSSDEDNRKQSGGTEDEQFEEARDHFDENLAPPPAFAGQAKSESPVRETRFQEQL